MLDSKLLEILVCPESKQPVTLADDTLIAQINERVSDASLKNRADKVVQDKIDSALVTEDKQYCYPVRADIPVMLVDEAIPLKQLSS